MSASKIESFLTLNPQLQRDPYRFSCIHIEAHQPLRELSPVRSGLSIHAISAFVRWQTAEDTHCAARNALKQPFPPFSIVFMLSLRVFACRECGSWVRLRWRAGMRWKELCADLLRERAFAVVGCVLIEIHGIHVF